MAFASRATFEPCPKVGLFDLSLYGVPVMLVGFAYILAASPLLLPNEGGGPESGAASAAVLVKVCLRVVVGRVG